VISSERVPIKLWLDDIEEGALEQAKNLANLPFSFRHVALMPDSHQGYGMPIGGVFAAVDVVVPNAVGVDIGCGMCALRTSMKFVEVEELRRIVELVRGRVPVGFEHHRERQEWEGFEGAPDVLVVQEELERAHFQLGTLGGGNHFIEFQQGSDGYVWVMLHSGSRNFGLKIANEYYRRARRLCERWYSLLTDGELAFLPVESVEGREYMSAMGFALEFAKFNRYFMLERVKESILEVVGGVEFDMCVNVHHNYAALEKHFGREVVVHRKGAISARDGQFGIIPGSQGTKSYVVCGKGSPESFSSCSHGAGRRLGRKQARRELSLEGERKRLDDLGIIHGLKTEEDLDEAPGAYKDIDVVMKSQEDLVEVIVELRPLAVIKG